MILSEKDALKFSAIQDRSKAMVEQDAARVALYTDMREMFDMEWSGNPKADWVKKIVSPDAYNSVMGILRLMMNAEPQINIPRPGESETLLRDEETERALRALLHKADEIAEVSAYHDMALSAVLFSDICVRVGNSADIIALVDKNSVLATQAKKIPFTIQTLNPATVFTESDIMGMRRVVICEIATVGDIREFWGDLADYVGQMDDTDEVTLYDYWDRTYRAVWIEDQAEPLKFGEHKLPFLPVVRRVVQGTNLWKNWNNAAIWPMLYPYMKSGFWDAQNIALTMIFSMAYAMGSVPFMQLKKKSMSQPDPRIDWDKPGINVTLEDGQELKRVDMGAIPPDMMQLLNIAENKVPQMTLPSVVFGQAPGGNMSYSGINLLTQGGRLPIVPVQERVADALSQALEIVLRWVKEEGQQRKMWDKGLLAVLDPQGIDLDSLYVGVKVAPDIPQDRMQMGTLVTQLVGAGIISKKTGREWLHILDDAAETEQFLLELFVQSQAEAMAKQIGEASDVTGIAPEGLAEDTAQMAEPGPPQAATEGPLFDLSQGGIPQVQTGNIQEIAPGIPGMPGTPPVLPRGPFREQP